MGKHTVSSASDVRSAIAADVEYEIEKLAFRAPAKYDGAFVPHHGLWYGDKCLPVAVKEGYTPHTRDDYSAICEASLSGLAADTHQLSIHWTGRGHRLTIDPMGSYRKEIGRGDIVGLRLYIDGSAGRPFTLQTGLYRLVCKNGMIAPNITSEIRIRHTIGLRSRMDDLIDDCRRSIDQFETIAARLQRLQSDRMQIREFINRLLPPPAQATGRGATQWTNKTTAIMSRLYREASQLGTPIEQGDDASASLWLLVNAVTGYVQHDATRHGAPSPATREELALTDDLTLHAWGIVDPALAS